MTNSEIDVQRDITAHHIHGERARAHTPRAAQFFSV
jgi:hypothetical protein